MENEYYVYIFLDQRYTGLWKFKKLEFKYKPFYIGKGKKDRLITHFREKLLSKNSYKNSVIKQIKDEVGELPIHYRLYDELTEFEAFEIEKELIAHFGRVKNGGILVNLTDGGDGHSGYHEPKIKKWKPIYQYNLNGEFIKKWDSLSHLTSNFKTIGNISTAVKRNGTAFGFIWSYTFKENFNPKIKYQMPVKYINIQQIDVKTGKLIEIFENALVIENKLKLRSGARNKIYECLNNKIKTAYGYKWQI